MYLIDIVHNPRYLETLISVLFWFFFYEVLVIDIPFFLAKLGDHLIGRSEQVRLIRGVFKRAGKKRAHFRL